MGIILDLLMVLNIEGVTEVIEDAKQVEGAVLIHVIPEKGKEVSILSSGIYHGVGLMRKNGMAKKQRKSKNIY